MASYTDIWNSYTFRIAASIVVALLALMLIPAVRRLWSRQRSFFKQQHTADTWKSYLRGQGLILFGFLIVGSLLGLLSFRLGPSIPRVVADGELIEIRDVDPSQQPVFEEREMGSYTHLMLLARTTAPENGGAAITLYGQEAGGSWGLMQRMQAISRWSKMERGSFPRRLVIVVDRPAGGTSIAATRVDVLLYPSNE